MKNGILLLNFGGPWTLKDVKPFLYRLFADPAVLHGVPAPLRQVIAFSIAQIKGRTSIKCYESIGGGSPQLKWTEIQAEGLRKLIQNDEVKIEIGMRNAEPTIENALRKLKIWGAERLILLPLFPQFSTTTTGTCFEEVKIRSPVLIGRRPCRRLQGGLTTKITLRFYAAWLTKK